LLFSAEEEKFTAELNPSSAVTESIKVAGWPAEICCAYVTFSRQIAQLALPPGRNETTAQQPVL
jgi:hypothetical protein